MTTTPTNETLLTFPCDFPLKIFGQGTDEFKADVLAIIHQHIPDFSDDALQVRESENGKYHALSAIVHVDSKQQLDGLYQALSSCKSVLMVL